METFDVIVVGAGHNGLTTAALLSRAGRRVLVVERRDTVGGLAGPVEFSPGYSTAGMLHDNGPVRAHIARKLGLSGHGMQVKPGRVPVVVLSEDGPNRMLQASAAFHEFAGAVGVWLARVFDRPLPGIAGTANTLRLLQHAAALRLLGRRAMEELLRLAPMSAVDFLDEFGDAESVQAALVVPTLASTFGGPFSAFGGLYLLLHEALNRTLVPGGGAALVAALKEAARGCTVRTGTAVEHILTGSGGAVSGVELSGGERIRAPVVAASCSPKSVFLDLIEPAILGPQIIREASLLRSRGTAAHVAIALDTRLEWLDAGPSARAVAGGTLAQIEKAFDAVKYGSASALPVLDIYVPTREHAGLAPPGHEVVTVTAHYVPYALSGEDKRRFERSVIRRLSRFAPGMAGHVVAVRTWTPGDIAREYAIPGGHLYHLEHAPDQLLVRPMSCSPGYAAPLAGLFLCGSGTHPGGGLTCAPGALAARAILADT